MARKPSDLTPPDTSWLTAHEARILLGGISRQRLQQLKLEHGIATETSDGVMRYAENAILELRDKMGLGGDVDPIVTAMQVLRDALESADKRVEAMTKYVGLIQESERQMADRLLQENESIRKLRAEEQAQHLKAILATQEALDLTSEREHNRIAAEAQQVRLNSATEFLITMVGPELLSQWRSGSPGQKIIQLTRALTPDQVAVLAAALTPEQMKIVEEIRNEQRPESNRATGRLGSTPGPDPASG